MTDLEKAFDVLNVCNTLKQYVHAQMSADADEEFNTYTIQIYNKTADTIGDINKQDIPEKEKHHLALMAGMNAYDEIYSFFMALQDKYDG